MHEFLIQDKLEIDLMKSYEIKDLLHYRLFVAACIISGKYINPNWYDNKLLKIKEIYEIFKIALYFILQKY